MEKWLYEMSWQEAAEQIKKAHGVAIIPVGSVEQHGPHLPLGTDSYVAIGLAQAAAKKADVVLAPPVWMGWCPHHMVLPSTISIQANTMINLIMDMITSLHCHGIDKFILINGHRIVNTVWMQIAGEKAQNQLEVTVKIFDPAYMSKDFVAAHPDMGPVGHAEEIESSHMMFMHPDLVHLEKAVDNPIHPSELYSVDPLYSHDTLCYVPTPVTAAKKHAQKSLGVTGSPSKSNVAFGKLYHEHLVMRLVQVIKMLQEA